MTDASERIVEFRPQRFRRYRDYKDSGIAWLRGIPAHWTPSRIKYLGKYINGYAFKPSDWGTVGRPILRIQDLNSSVAEPNRYDGEVDGRYLVRPGEILISWSGSLGVYRWDGEEAWLNQHIYRVLVDKSKVRSDYFVWLGQWFVRELESEMHGSTMRHLTTDTFGRFAVLLPPSAEQENIAAYLACETARIDALVAKKERLIELLQEKRTALITHAVTQGVDPNVPMKDSGVGWLGKVPAHWKIISTRRLILRIEQGWSPVADDRPAAPDEWGVIKLSAVSGGSFREEEHKTLPSGVPPDPRYEIREKDFLLTRSNTPDLVGDVCVVDVVRDRLMLCDLVYRLNLVDDRIDRNFLAYWFLSRSGRHQIEVEARGSSRSMVKVSQGIIRAWTVAKPPLDEQAEIAEFLDQETAKIDALIAGVRRAMDHLDEYRTALISAAVTGKIDVRKEAA